MSWLLWNTVTAAVLALVVMWTCRVFRPRPAIAHVLWLLVLIKLACPPLLRWELPLPMASEAARPIDLAALLDTPHEVSAPALLADAPEPSLPWLELAAWVWLLGSVTLGGTLLLGIVRMNRRLRRSDTPSEALLQAVRNVARRLDVPMPLVLCDARCSSPFVWSIGPACLVLPPALAAMSASSREALLAHELAHLRRRDHWIARAEALLAVALWWHPLFWLARARMRQEAELACDAWALWATPESRFAYADALISSLEPRSTAALLPVLAARAGARAAFERRLKMILNENVPCRLSGQVLAPLCALALGLFAMPTLAQDEPSKAGRYEITVNGRQLNELDARQRRALLDALKRIEKESETGAETDTWRRDEASLERKSKQSPKGKAKTDQVPKLEVTVEVQGEDAKTDHWVKHGTKHEAQHETKHEATHESMLEKREQNHARKHQEEHEGLLKALIRDAELGENLKIVLEDVKTLHEIRPSLKVVEVRDEDGEHAVKDTMKKALQGIHDDKGVMHDLHKIIGEALHGALHEAHAEIAKDPDLKKLGITKDVQDLVNSLLGGQGHKGLFGGKPDHDFSDKLGTIIQKAMKAALEDAKDEARDLKDKDSDSDADEMRAKPKDKGKAKQSKPVRGELR